MKWFYQYFQFSILGEEPAAIQSSGANQVLLFSKPSVEKLCFRFSFIVPCKMCWHLSLLIFLIYLLSYKVCLPLQTSLPISKSVTYTNIHTTKTTSCKSLQMSGQKQNTGVGAICIQSTLNTNEQTNTTSSAAAFNSSCHKKSSWPIVWRPHWTKALSSSLITLIVMKKIYAVYWGTFNNQIYKT